MSRLLRSGAVVGAMTMISRVLGLVRDVVFANYFLIGGAMDAFMAAFRIPNLMRRLFAEGAFSLAFIPVLSEYKETRSKEDLKRLIDHVAGTLGTILLVITIIGMLIAPWLIMAITPGFANNPDARPELAAELLRITFPYILFISLSAFISGILNTFKQFAIPAFTPVLLNVVLISSALWLAPYFDEPVKALAWGVFIGGIAQFLFQIPALMKLGLFPRFSLKRGYEGVNRIMKLMVPALFGSSVAQLNLLINTAIASMLGTGFITWLYYSDRFVELPLALIGVAIGVVILPKLSGNHAKEEKQAFSATLGWAARLSLLAAFPAMLGLILLATPILATVIDNGVNGWHDVEMASMSLMTYAFGLPAFILVKVLVPGFYSRQDTKTPVKIGIIAIFTNMFLNLIIVLPWYKIGYPAPHAGLALSTAIAGYVNAGLLFYTLKKQNIYQTQQGTLKHILQVMTATLIMGLSIWWLIPADSWWQQAGVLHKISMLFGLIGLSMLIYFISLLVVGVKPKRLLNDGENAK
jgi:putative peptidoglycan lipid II flippase